MVYALHKLIHYLLGNKFVFYVNHMALMYMVTKSQISRIITKWLMLFSKYDLKIVYKSHSSHLMVDALNRLSNKIELVSVPNQTTMFICSFYNQSGYKIFMITY